jgi:transposase
MTRMFLKDKDWEKLSLLLPSQAGKQGRPRKNDRLVIEGIVWIIRTGAPWRDMPSEFGSWQTVYSRMHNWTLNGTWAKIWSLLKKKCIPRITYY